MKLTQRFLYKCSINSTNVLFKISNTYDLFGQYRMPSVCDLYGTSVIFPSPNSSLYIYDWLAKVISKVLFNLKTLWN